MSPPLPDARYSVNCSLIFTELPLLQRPAAARAAGFAAVEFWWPFDAPAPTAGEVAAFERAITDAGVQLSALNFYAGDLPGPDAGVASIPDRADEFAASVPVAVDIGRRLGTRRFNALYGNRVEGVAPEAQDALAITQLAAATQAAAGIDATVMIEPVSGPKPYPLRTAVDAMAVVERVRAAAGSPNVGLLADLFHLASNGDDVDAAISRYRDDIAGVQVADLPGRHQPGTGSLELGAQLTALLAGGYDGWIGLEYVPSGASSDSFGWRQTPSEPV